MSQLLNLIGLSTGVALYAMLLAMVVRRDQARETSGRPDPLLLATAVLGLLWNLCALPAYELPKIGVQRSLVVLTAIGFSALGFLPAVVVHSVLRGEGDRLQSRPRRAAALAAYAVSALAAFLQARAAWTGLPVPTGRSVS